VSRLFVGSRDCSKLVVGGMLCFVEGDWPLGGDFMIDGLSVLWPRKAAGLILKPGTMDAATADRVHRALALAFPPA